MAKTKVHGAGILIVDDNRTNVRVIEESLKNDYKIEVSLSGFDAMQKILGGYRPDLVLLDIMMPGLDGYEVCKILKANEGIRDIPVIFITSKSEVEDESRGLSCGAVDYITKPFSTQILKARIHTQLELQGYRNYLEDLVEERTSELVESQKEIIYRLTLASEYRDNETGKHIKRISHYSRLIAQTYGFNRDEADLLYDAASMHDIGKIGIPDNILLKPAKLEPGEWEIMKTHTTIGAKILSGNESKLFLCAKRIAVSHHERWNGTGYPLGLSGTDIPIEGRIVSICDVFDALLSQRPYKDAWTFDRTVDYMNRQSGILFDSELMKVFRIVVDDLYEIWKKLAD